jgi:hypothetical protein
MMIFVSICYLFMVSYALIDFIHKFVIYKEAFYSYTKILILFIDLVLPLLIKRFLVKYSSGAMVGNGGNKNKP